MTAAADPKKNSRGSRKPKNPRKYPLGVKIANTPQHNRSGQTNSRKEDSNIGLSGENKRMTKLPTTAQHKGKSPLWLAEERREEQRHCFVTCFEGHAGKPHGKSNLILPKSLSLTDYQLSKSWKVGPG
ncbi:hypothetical protein RUM44_011588 [Polyplax serrata]|uniref:Uncharacterized protein n=1 Tax=Polyplax serrata TaxID=468196 RepID=A0ABR1AQF8_POLSC